jgi:Flp pilus assembly pilin Flp
MGGKLNRLMKQSFRRLYRDEDGVVAVSDYVLLGTIVAIGAVVGLVTLRDSVIQELGDVGIGLENLQQNYTVSMTFATVSGGTTTTSFGYTTDNNPTEQPSGQSTAGIDLSIAPSDESTTPGAVDSNG